MDTFVVQVLSEFLRGFGEWQQFILGVFLLALLVLQPAGLVRLLGRLFRGMSDWMNAPPAAKERAAQQDDPSAETRLPEGGSSDVAK